MQTLHEGRCLILQFFRLFRQLISPSIFSFVPEIVPRNHRGSFLFALLPSTSENSFDLLLWFVTLKIGSSKQSCWQFFQSCFEVDQLEFHLTGNLNLRISISGAYLQKIHDKVYSWNGAGRWDFYFMLTTYVYDYVNENRYVFLLWVLSNHEIQASILKWLV